MPDTLGFSVQEGGTLVVPVSFTDEAGNSVVPKTILWSLRNERGEIVNGREGEQEEPAESVDIVLSGDDLERADGRHRHLTVTFTYDSDAGTDLPGREALSFHIAVVP